MSLSESTQQLITHFCQTYCPNETEIVLTGSTARGEMSANSDIDLLVFNQNHDETQIDVLFQNRLFQVSYLKKVDSSLSIQSPDEAFDNRYWLKNVIVCDKNLRLTNYQESVNKRINQFSKNDYSHAFINTDRRLLNVLAQQPARSFSAYQTELWLVGQLNMQFAFVNGRKLGNQAVFDTATHNPVLNQLNQLLGATAERCSSQPIIDDFQTLQHACEPRLVQPYNAKTQLTLLAGKLHRYEIQQNYALMRYTMCGEILFLFFDCLKEGQTLDVFLNQFSQPNLTLLNRNHFQAPTSEQLQTFSKEYAAALTSLL